MFIHRRCHPTYASESNPSLQCESIAPGSDPSIDCGNTPGDAHICVRCGGQLVVGVAQPGGGISVGYVSMMPGSWNLLQDKNGRDLPVLKSIGTLFNQMGVTVMRSGGTVSQGMRWKVGQWEGGREGTRVSSADVIHTRTSSANQITILLETVCHYGGLRAISHFACQPCYHRLTDPAAFPCRHSIPYDCRIGVARIGTGHPWARCGVTV